MNRRGSGILLHISSIPSMHGIGDLGPGAYRFADFLVETKQCLWQILPLNPTSTVHGNSPYSSFSAFAGNPLFISPDLLFTEDLISLSDLDELPSFPDIAVDYEAVTEHKNKILGRAFERYMENIGQDYEFERFCVENENWLDDYALFISVKDHFNGIAWCDWPEDIRDRCEDTIKEWSERLKERVLKEKFLQYLFFKQWHMLKGYCNERNIKIIGDLPIYVCYDSCDVWANPCVFKLNGEKKPDFVSGVPPDYFSETGQLWGTPVYSWSALKEDGYTWWIKRIEHNMKLFDTLRLDHFRGFVAYWEVPAHETTAMNGRWVDAPVYDFFDTLMRHFSSLPFIAEDLGVITPDVREVMNIYEFPGMKLLIFAFGGDMPANPYIPHNITKNSVVYTGTHDNNTIRGWFSGEASHDDKIRVFKYMGKILDEESSHLDFIRHAMMSVANTSIIPMQDILGLGEEGRMNTPSVCDGNWRWRLRHKDITHSIKKELTEMTEIYGRA
ncbi:MAG TPA: 4-alpha-glucanotransferase [Thermodesulfobacteriota bacterium]|nr:4-alpha-glucanotransferase [Thermodesulfobacteriota bacterium]